MSKERYNFASPIHLACADDKSRPIFECVHFINRFIYASDGTMLVKQSIDYSQVIESIKLEGKSIHGDSFKEALTYKIVTATDEGLQCKDDDRETFFYYSKFSDKLPDFESIISSHCCKSVDFIGFDPKKIAISGKVLIGGEYSGIKVTFNGIDKGMMIEVLGYENQLVYLMPRILEPTLF